MRHTLTLISSLVLLILTSVFIAASATGEINVRAEGQAERGFFNKGKGPELPEDFVGDRDGFLKIPLPEGVGEESVSVVNDIYANNVIVSIRGTDEDFYKKNFFSGDMTNIDDVRYGYSDGTSVVELKTDRISVPVMEFSKGNLYIKVADPHSVYDRIIVVDAGHGGSDPGSVVYGVEEKDITSAIAERLKDLIGSGDKNYAVYLSAKEDTDASEEEREAFADKISADLIISLHTGADPDSRVTNGVGINTTPELKDRAAKLCTSLAGACGQQDLGVSTERVPGVTENTEIPFFRIRLGYITNKYEAEKMNSRDYQDKAAEKIASFVNENE